MPIEIKELHIKVKIEEDVHNEATSDLNLQSENVKNWKDSIVKECVDKVLEKLKDQQER